MKLGAGTLLSPIEFPLWVGRVWRFASTASMRGHPATGRRTAVEIECVATAFEPVTVTAGHFEAFQCKCQCTVSGVGIYEDDCGTWTVWYAPQAKNIVRVDAQSTAASAELQEYKISNRVLEAGAAPEKSTPRSAPKDALVFNKSGDAYRSKGDYDRAIQDYNEAIRLNPNYAAAFNNRGIAYRSKRDYNQAIADYDQAIKLSPNNAAFLNNRGNAYRDRGDHDRAIQDYNEAIRLNPDYALAFTNRGITYGRKRDYDRAIADYDQAIKLNPNNAVVLNNRGNAHRNNRDYERALADYEAAARIDPQRAQDRSMGYTLFFLERMAESASAMERRVSAAPQDLYAILWRYITVAKNKGLQTASRELGENASKLKERRWPAPVIDFYLGKIDEKAMFAAAKNPDQKKNAEQICEANFYAGEAKLLRAAIGDAIQLLRAADRDCPPTFYESHGASAELKRLSH
jgi:lipoprotein NlpI